MVKIVAVLFLFAILVFVIELVRREMMTFKYALAWMFVCVAGIFFAIFDKVLYDIARFFGFQLPSNFIFFAVLSIFVLLTLMMTVFLCQQDRHNDTIAQKIAMLTYELDQLKQKHKKTND